MTLTSEPSQCPFCTLPASRIVEENGHCVLILDGYPVSPGHGLVIPKRHVGSFFEVTAPERAALFALLGRAKERIAAQHRPSGYNIGINDGAAWPITSISPSNTFHGGHQCVSPNRKKIFCVTSTPRLDLRRSVNESLVRVTLPPGRPDWGKWLISAANAPCEQRFPSLGRQSMGNQVAKLYL